MTDAEILAIASKFTRPEVTEEQCFYDDGSASREVHTMVYWTFCTEELLAFAQEVRAYESEDDQWPMCYWDGDDKPGSVRFDKRTERHKHPLYRHHQRPSGLDQLLKLIRFLEQQIAEKNQ